MRNMIEYDDSRRGSGSLFLLMTLFFFSGFAALIYEVLFSKELSLSFGSSSMATYTVLATYMGGMAVGSWLGGRLASLTNKWILVYLLCEFAIAIYCCLTPVIFSAVLWLYVKLAANSPVDALWVVSLRFVLGVMILSVPTVLMGMTLPVLTAYLGKRRRGVSDSIALLYGSNTLGAALGALFAGYLIIPALGLTRTTFLAASINMLIAFIAMKFAKSDSRGILEINEISEPCVDDKNLVSISDSKYLSILFGLFAMGCVCLGLEILYIHLLAVVAGNSTYAFSLMLFAFLLGLGFGAAIVRRVRFALDNPELAMCVLSLLLVLIVSISAFQWEGMADYFAGFAGYVYPKTFAARELIRGVVCMLLLFPPALIIGAFYPLAMGGASQRGGVRGVGLGASINTLGNITGVFLGGMFLLPVVGALVGIKVFAVLALFAALCIALSWRIKSGLLFALFVFATASVFLTPSTLDYTKISSGANVYFFPQNWGRVLDYAESADGGLTAVHENILPDGRKTRVLTTNGKFQGNDSGEMQAQIGFALVPLAKVQHRGDALVIGYGTGMTTATLKYSGFRQIDVVDLSKDVFALADRYFDHINESVSTASGVTAFVADGRNYLLLNDKKYDLITVELSSIWFAGAASVYNREFYALAKKRMTNNGVLQQWVQLHHISKESLLRLIAAIRAEFGEVQLYGYGGQGMLVARDIPNVHKDSNAMDPFSEPVIKGFVQRTLGHAIDSKPVLLLDGAGVDRFLSVVNLPVDILASTDDNGFLEYETPKGNVLDANNSYNENIKMLSSFGSH